MTTEPPEAPNPDLDRDDQVSSAGSSFGNLETAEGGADAVPGTPDVTPSTGASDIRD